MRLRSLSEKWNAQSLARQFLLTGGLISLAAMLLVGAFVTRLIEEAVTRNSAAATALYVDSVIAPLLPDMQNAERLDDSVARALDETLAQGALRNRLIDFRLWGRDGTILYANHKSIVGKRFPIGDNLARAFKGEMRAEYDQLDDADVRAHHGDMPLLEIYNPVLQPWSGKVVAVLEFYEVAQDFERSLVRARMKSWLAAISFTAALFAALSVIVFRGSRTIQEQRGALKARVGELSNLLAQNESLRTRVERASQRVTALNESHLRRIGADLHDGPAQLVALAALRLDSQALIDPGRPPAERERELSSIKASLDDAMNEIRSICTGLVLPQIDKAGLGALLQRVVNAHEQRTGDPVSLVLSGNEPDLSPSARICIYRFVQEALNNASRHADGDGLSVRESADGERIIVEVSDTGPGFDPEEVDPERLGLSGLRERIESLGGTFHLISAGEGTCVRLCLNTGNMEPS